MITEKDLVQEIQKDFDSTEHGKQSFFQKLGELGLIPFDLHRSLGDQLYYFGYLGTGDMIGRHVQVPSVPKLNIEGEEYDLSNAVGTVVGDFGGRLVIEIETLYFGWVETTDCIVPINYQEPPSNIQ